MQLKTCLLVFLIVIFLFLTYCGEQHLSKRYPNTVNGILDLSHWDFEKSGIVKLNGHWEFYWKQLLEPKDFIKKNTPNKTGYIKLPNSWRGYEINGEKLSGAGYATFRLIIKLKESYGLTIKIPTILTAYKLWINGKSLSYSGVVGKSENDMKPQISTQALIIKPQKNTVELILQVSNYTHIMGGVYLYSLELGTGQQIKEAREHQIAIDLFLLGCILFMGIYHLILYVQRKKDPSTLYFGIACTTMAFYPLFYGETFFLNLFPHVDWEIFIKLKLFNVYIPVTAMAMYFKTLFPKEVSNIYVRTNQLVILIIMVILLLTPSKINTYTIFVLHILLAGNLFYEFYFIILAIVRKREGAILVLIGRLILTITVFNDVLFVEQVINTTVLLPFGSLFFIVILSILLSLKFSRAFHSVENMSERLLSLDKLKNEFLANTTHELKTPINGIIGITESLIDGVTGSLPEPTISNLSMIAISGKRLAHLVNDILDFSKLKHHDITLNKKAIDMKQITELVMILSKPLLSEKPLELKNEISDDLPPVLGDENRLQQIIHNLIGNAIKFSDSGTISVSARVSRGLINQIPTTHHSEQSEEFSYLEITVSDTGIGIPLDKHDAIFESFEQADFSTSRAYGGTGLGLSITKQLIELHGGSISLESTVGKGSKFIFTIPLSKEQVKPISKQLITGVQNQLIDVSHDSIQIDDLPQISDNGMSKILAVDDDPINLQVVSNFLSLQNHSVTGVLSGVEALKATEKDDFNLILLDIMMPKMNGYDVCKKLREKYSANELPIILLTAKNQVSDLVEGLDAGANDYLTKPISKGELLARIKTHTENASFYLKIKELSENLDHLMKEFSRLTTKIHNSLKNKLESTRNFLNEYLKSPEKSADNLTIVSQLLTHCSTESNNILFVLQNRECTIEKLLQELEMRAELTLTIRHINYTFHKQNLIQDHIFHPEKVQNILDVYTELLNNIVKHSSASKVDITIDQTESQFTLSIKDYGVGFDYSKEKNKSNSYGLKLLEQLTQQANITLSFKTSPDRGTFAKLIVKINDSPD